MSDVRSKYAPASISETAFNCPHCGALANQFWSVVLAKPLGKGGTPLIVDEGEAFAIAKERLGKIEDKKERQDAERWLSKMAAGRPSLYGDGKTKYGDREVLNLSISQCYNCDDIAIWIYDRLVWPRQGGGPLPSPDLPAGIRDDYEEASTILDLSPRGAAALLRLCIQKLCGHLGEPGKNINDDIAALVKKGFDERVQKGLDVVRVVGNNAVHPGQIDLKDDRATAEKLFGLVNLITEIMISQPKHVDSMYQSLPEPARKAIEKRDGKK